MANISEGFDPQSKSQFAQFLAYAIRSASEVQSHLYVALDQGFINGDEFRELYVDVANTKNLAGGFIRYLMNRPAPNSSTAAQQY
jgi:four helix bundle protein